MSYCTDCGNWHDGRGGLCLNCKDLSYGNKSSIRIIPLKVEDRKLIEKRQYHSSISSQSKNRKIGEGRTARIKLESNQFVSQYHNLPHSVLNRMHCPECKKQSIWHDQNIGEYLCTSCGIVINESEILKKYHKSKRIKK